MLNYPDKVIGDWRWIAAAGLSLCGGIFPGGAHANDQSSFSFRLSTSPAGRDAPPNVVLITADDLGIQVGCYDDPQAETPRLDQMAAEGVMFRTAWVTAATCSPSRASMFTGLYAFQNGQWGLSNHDYAIHEGIATISSLLKNEGYRTALIAKFHMAPTEAFAWDEMWPPPARYRTAFFDERDVRQMADLAQAFIQGSEDTPFFLSMNYVDPHYPLFDQRHGLPEDPWTGEDVVSMPLYGMDTPELRAQTASFYNCIRRLDTGIGYFLDMLEASGHAENTLIIFIGDHGPPFTRAKLSCYDFGMRVPFIVQFPGRAVPGQVRDEMVSAIDILPTILDAVGVTPTDPLPGRSLMPLLAGEHIPWREYLYGEFNSHARVSWYPRRTVRDQRFQLIENPLYEEENPTRSVGPCLTWEASRDSSLDGTAVRMAYDRWVNPPRFELIDLEADPYAFENLADNPEYLEVLSHLRARLDEWRQDMHDPLLSAVTFGRMTREHRER